MAKKNKKRNQAISKIMKVILFLIAILFVLSKAKNYVKEEISEKTNFILNFQNVTANLSNSVVIENNIVYLSQKDIATFFDSNITFDEQYQQIITSSFTKLATIPRKGTQIQINSSKKNVKGVLLEKEDQLYLPLSELEDVYGIKVSYNENNNVVIVDSLDKDFSVATTKKNVSVKAKPTIFSRTLETIKGAETIALVNSTENSSWTKVRTNHGVLGYVKTKSLGEGYLLREEIKPEKKVADNIELLWVDNVKEISSSQGTQGILLPSFFSLEKLGKGKIIENWSGKEDYVTFAHQNGYQVWAILTNDSMKQTTSEIMNDYKLRETLINEIMEAMMEYKLDGINIDFEEMKEEDKKLFSQFLVELAPRMNEIGRVLCVDVLENKISWPNYFEKETIKKQCDYVIETK